MNVVVCTHIPKQLFHGYFHRIAFLHEMICLIEEKATEFFLKGILVLVLQLPCDAGMIKGSLPSNRAETLVQRG